MSLSNNAQIGLRDIVVALVTAFTTLGGSYFAFQRDKNTADVEMVRTLYEQVQQLQQDLFEAQSQIVELKIELSKKHESSQILKDYLDGNNNPSFIKLVDDSGARPRFPNWHVNDAYERMFGISAARYVGKLDSEIWPDDVAEQFYKNDLHAYDTMGTYCTKERFPKTPKSKTMVSGHVCKWTTFLHGRVAIAGQILIMPDTEGKK